MSNFLRKLKKCGEFCPVCVPGTQNRRILLVPFFPELLFRILGIIKIDRTINLLEIGADRFSVSPLHEFDGISDLMHDAKLLLRPRKHSVDGLSKTLQIVMASDENVLYTALFEVGTDGSIEARSLVFTDPNA